MFHIDGRWLIALYLVLPVSACVVLIDQLLLNEWLRLDVLPSNPENWPLWNLVFGLPHIVASAMVLARSKYVSYFKKDFTRPVTGIVAFVAFGFFGPQPISLMLCYAVLAFYTVYHVLAQQIGLSGMLARRPKDTWFKLWKWLCILAGFAIYIHLYVESRIDTITLFGMDVSLPLSFLSLALSVCQLMLAVYISLKSESQIGKWYVLANGMMVMLVQLVGIMGYSMLVVLIPRIVHDLTAYYVYLTHEINMGGTRTNKSGDGVNQIQSLLLVSIRLPVLSMVIAAFLSWHSSNVLIAPVVMTLTLLHYYFEGVVWRGTSPLRGLLPFRFS